MNKIVIFHILYIFSMTSCGNIVSSKPFISGYTFRTIAQHELIKGEKFNPNDVKTGDIIFVSTDSLQTFFSRYHPNIKTKYILVTHNSDKSVPEKFKKYLDDQKLFTWFGENPDIKNHPKFIPIPIGLPSIIQNFSHLNLIKEFTHYQCNKKNLLYCNFDVNTNYQERRHLLSLFKNKPFCLTRSGLKLRDYFKDICESKFVLSPAGNGLDCYRTWETLYLNSIPIVKSSQLDPIFEDLPVLIIPDWKEITPEFLQETYNKFQQKAFNKEKIFFKYWENLIKNYQKMCRNLQ